jgi:hypothetical protein
MSLLQVELYISNRHARFLMGAAVNKNRVIGFLVPNFSEAGLFGAVK